MTNDSLQDLYGVLGVARHATRQEIIHAYRRLALNVHSDRNIGDRWADDDTKLVCTPRIARSLCFDSCTNECTRVQLNQAYETLSDNNERRMYDAQHPVISSTEEPHVDNRRLQEWLRKVRAQLDPVYMLRGEIRARATTSRDLDEELQDVIQEENRAQDQTFRWDQSSARVGAHNFRTSHELRQALSNNYIRSGRAQLDLRRAEDAYQNLLGQGNFQGRLQARRVNRDMRARFEEEQKAKAEERRLRKAREKEARREATRQRERAAFEKESEMRQRIHDNVSKNEARHNNTGKDQTKKGKPPISLGQSKNTSGQRKPPEPPHPIKEQRSQKQKIGFKTGGTATPTFHAAESKLRTDNESEDDSRSRIGDRCVHDWVRQRRPCSCARCGKYFRWYCFQCSFCRVEVCYGCMRGLAW